MDTTSPLSYEERRTVPTAGRNVLFATPNCMVEVTKCFAASNVKTRRMHNTARTLIQPVRKTSKRCSVIITSFVIYLVKKQVELLSVQEN